MNKLFKKIILIIIVLNLAYTLIGCNNALNWLWANSTEGTNSAIDGIVKNNK